MTNFDFGFTSPVRRVAAVRAAKPTSVSIPQKPMHAGMMTTDIAINDVAFFLKKAGTPLATMKGLLTVFETFAVRACTASELSTETAFAFELEIDNVDAHNATKLLPKLLESLHCHGRRSNTGVEVNHTSSILPGEFTPVTQRHDCTKYEFAFVLSK